MNLTFGTKFKTISKNIGFLELSALSISISLALIIQPGIGLAAEQVTITCAAGSMGGNW
jgi:hypothetical protein